MRYVAAYLLAALGGNGNPEAKDIKKILESVGIEADDTRLGKVQSSLHFVSDVVAAALLPAASHCLGVIHKCDFSQQVITELAGKNVEEVIVTGEFLPLYLCLCLVMNFYFRWKSEQFFFFFLVAKGCIAGGGNFCLAKTIRD